MSDKLDSAWKVSHLDGANATYLESLYESYLEDPTSVEDAWRAYFDSFQVKGEERDVPHQPVREAFIALAKGHRLAPYHTGVGASVEGMDKIPAIMDLIYAYRQVGHQQANIDPLNMMERLPTPELSPSFHGLSEQDLNASYSIKDLLYAGVYKLSDILAELKKIYCSNIGFQYMHISDIAERMWMKEHIESRFVKRQLPADKQQWLLKRLTVAESMEQYLGRNFVGQKRFSLEGGDALIPMLDEIIQVAGTEGVKEIALAMAHRGRLNVLVNIMGKAPSELFKEFKGEHSPDLLAGDVKYHNGFSSDVTTPGGIVHLALGFNPSHLEIASPVIEGSVRARQDRRGEGADNEVLAIHVHGDAAFSGQGVVMETLNMALTRGFYVGGSIHIVLNNQVGFTTSNPKDMRSTVYCTDIGKMLEVPIFHVNGDDPEAVLLVVQLALEYRMTFNKNVIIDLVCYRRHGHNESDEPMATQPLMYKVIKKHPTPRKIYADKLLKDTVLSAADIKQYQDDAMQLMQGDNATDHVVSTENFDHEHIVDWTPYVGATWDMKYQSQVSKRKLLSLAKRLDELPDELTLQKQVGKTYEDRARMTAQEIPANWGYAELLAYATLVDAGHSVRLCGEDSGRGTFAHRHCELHDVNDGSIHIPLQHVSKQQADFTVINSILSEEAVVAFEYGYSSSSPQTLVIWEAQFGDFVNVAQVVIDQFISSAQEKWGRLCGLVMYLPHGFEGMGAEHSSARLERFLHLCANDNMQVCVPTTPAQMYHLIRRQAVRPYRTPLVIMTPKSLLRHPRVTSTIDELAKGQFEVVLPEADAAIKPKQVKRLIFCQGKVYYDLLLKREELSLTDTAIIRVEQLYPVPHDALVDLMKSYHHVEDVVWAQEEPRNMGAWLMIQYELRQVLPNPGVLRYAGRERAASPAVGYPSLHRQQQDALVNEAFGLAGSSTSAAPAKKTKATAKRQPAKRKRSK